MLLHPDYCQQYDDNLRQELPRIPFAPNFKAFVTTGKELARLHLGYEEIEPYPLDFNGKPGIPLSYKVDDRLRLNREKTAIKVNRSLTLSGIPPETCQYQLGLRSALEWVIDQYRPSEDARTGISTDPFRDDDPEQVVRLIGQVVRLSVDTVRLLASVPAFR